MKRFSYVAVFGLAMTACVKPSAANLDLRVSGGSALTRVAPASNVASTSPMSDAQGTPVTISSAKLHVREIRLGLSAPKSCQDMNTTLHAPLSCDGHEVRVAGPFVVDLASSQPIATLSALNLPPVTLNRVDVRLDASSGRSERAETHQRRAFVRKANGADDPNDDNVNDNGNDPNGDHGNDPNEVEDPNDDRGNDPNDLDHQDGMDSGDTIELVGTVTMGQRSVPFALKIKVPTSLVFNSATGIALNSTSLQKLVLELDASKWVAALPIAACAGGKDAQACTKLQDAIAAALQASANITF